MKKKILIKDNFAFISELKAKIYFDKLHVAIIRIKV